MRDETPFSTWHGPFGHTSMADEELRQELRATLLAVRELGPEFDQAATDAFIDRVSPALAARLGSRNWQAVSRPQRSRLHKAAVTAAVVIGAMMIAGPFMHGSHARGPRYGWYGDGGFVVNHRVSLPAVPNPPQAPAAPPALPAPPPPPTF